MKCQSVTGHRVPDVHGREDETGLWRKPPGTWRWVLGSPRGDRILEAVLPTRYPVSEHNVHPHLMCHCPVEEGPPAKKRQVWGWDGNVELPTLSPSILTEVIWGEEQVRVFWHGYMKAGNFNACE